MRHPVPNQNMGGDDGRLSTSSSSGRFVQPEKAGTGWRIGGKSIKCISITLRGVVRLSTSFGQGQGGPGLSDNGTVPFTLAVPSFALFVAGRGCGQMLTRLWVSNRKTEKEQFFLVDDQIWK